MAKPIKQDPKGQVSTTGHSWDGIEELNNPLPRWWVWVFYLTIIWGVGYVVAFPAWPLITGATPGLLGASTRADVAVEIQRFDDQNAPIKAKLVSTDLTAIASDDTLKSYAMQAGAALFATNCAPCHGRGAGGVQAGGYPNLLDNDWLWGGDIEAIHTTITHGIRNIQDPDARLSQMPAFGKDGILTAEQIGQVVDYVFKISGQEHDAAAATEGAVLFTENCAACHGEDGKGIRDVGSPNLTDAIWLYGGDRATLTETITNARYGIMPAWGYAGEGQAPRMTEDQIRAVAVYVHSLGGGE